MFETSQQQYQRDRENKRRQKLRVQLAKDLVNGRISGSYYMAETAKLAELPAPAVNTEDAEYTNAAKFQEELQRRFP
jgi:hypothetical protein